MFNVSHLTQLFRKVARRKQRERAEDVQWKAVTTLPDGKKEWNWSKYPAAEAAKSPRVEPADPGYLERLKNELWMKQEPGKFEWWAAVEAAETNVNGLCQRRRREARVLRRLMRTTVKRLAAAVNRVVDEEGSGRRRVKVSEVNVAFQAFLLDSKSDKGLTEPWDYRKWLWTDRNTVYLAPVGRRKPLGKGRVAG